MSTDSDIPPAAGVVYDTGGDGPEALRAFAIALSAEGWRVGGLVQEVLRFDDGIKRGIDIVDLDTNARLPLTRNTREQLEGRVCTLDTTILAEASAALRRAVDQRMDLVVVEKFGDRERRGAGLYRELTEIMMAGIPLLVAVPRPAADEWEAVTGGLASLLPDNDNALRDWWATVRGEIGRADPI